ncbi:hypothetical protein HL657_10160 [Methanoculleus sp. YWC-01]|jgi:hypothetical protein|uniref:Uncharacterized protein n=1 Tax=Methanoculleus nereidis TaxID=2735141 RepID=A0ABU3Z3Y1_9EURY|nr:hypothetical protein [Methanoculleus sp. YWC-01]MDV4343523.1 hypothetical protein [Methanoculleus sp. YWC-01]
MDDLCRLDGVLCGPAADRTCFPERTLDGEGYDRVYASGSASLFVLDES